MSRYLIDQYQSLEAYTPGEQPQDMQYVKLNTNESPYPPAPSVSEAVYAESKRLQLYCDPTCAKLRDAIAGLYGVERDNVYVANGSDDILYFAFMAFAGRGGKAYFPDITYGGLRRIAAGSRFHSECRGLPGPRRYDRHREPERADGACAARGRDRARRRLEPEPRGAGG